MGRVFLSLGSDVRIAKCLAQRLKHHLVSIYYVHASFPRLATQVSYAKVIGDTQGFHGEDQQAENHSNKWQ